MKPFKVLLVIIGVIIFTLAFIVNVWIVGVIMWFAGVILVYLGLSSKKNEGKKCPKCGWDRPKDAIECSHCGSRFDD